MGVKTNADVITGPTSGIVQSNPDSNVQQLRFDINKFFSEYNSNQATVNAYYPILQKRLATGLNNLIIEGNMMTNYDRESGDNATHGYSTIQVGKASSGLANALGGYGVAWKPLVGSASDATPYGISTIRRVGIGEYEITLSSPYPAAPQTGFSKQTGYLRIPYRGTSTYVFVSIQFMEYYDGNKVRCLTGNSELLDGLTSYTGTAIYLVRPNVYIIDFTSSINDINMWDNLSDEMGFLSFLNCGVADIKPNIDYKFTMTITADNGITFAIDTPEFSLTAPSRIPMYDFIEAEDTDSLGLSVYGTDGFKWYYDNIKISSMASQYPYLYCVFTPDNLRDSVYVKAIARGINGNNTLAGINIYACNNEGEWVKIGYNPGADLASITSDVINKEDYTFRGSINVILIGANPGNESGNSLIDIDTVSIVNSEAIATHIGGFVDAYIDALCVEKSYELQPDPNTGALYLDNQDKGIVQIIGLYRDGVELINNIDYVLALDDYSYTCRGSITVSTRYVYDTIIVKALVCPALVTINTGMASRNISPLGYDLLVRHRHVHYLDVSGVDRSTILPYLSDYVQSLPRTDGVVTLTYANFIFYLLQNNVTTKGVVIVDTYIENKQTRYNYMITTGDQIVLDKVSCFRVSSGQ